MYLKSTICEVALPLLYEDFSHVDVLYGKLSSGHDGRPWIGKDAAQKSNRKRKQLQAWSPNRPCTIYLRQKERSGFVQRKNNRL